MFEPWTVRIDAQQGDVDVYAETPDGDHLIAACNLCDPFAMTFEDHCRHARLIAAAPRLLAVLEALCDKYNAYDFPELWREAEAAIAEAKGEG